MSLCGHTSDNQDSESLMVYSSNTSGKSNEKSLVSVINFLPLCLPISQHIFQSCLSRRGYESLCLGDVDVSERRSVG